MPEISSIVVDLFVIFLAAKLGGELLQRIGQPPVIGELLAGVLIGPHALGLIGAPGLALVGTFQGDTAAATEALHLVYDVLAELGAIVLLFYVGLETRVSDLLRVGRRALAVAVLGIAFPFILGLVFMVLQPTERLTDAFTATTLVATSVGITARVMRDLGVLGTRESQIILGAAVIDDVLAMLLLATVVAMSTGEGGGAAGEPWHLLILLGQAAGFVLFIALVGSRAVHRYSVHVQQLRIENAPFAVALLLTLGLAALSGIIGLAAIIGAFLAGIVLAEAREQYQFERQARPLYEFLVPFFFVVTGAGVNVTLFGDPGVLVLAAVLTLLAIVGKLLGGGIGGWGASGEYPALRSAALVGVGMVPRGEVGLIIAGIGRGQGVIPDPIFSALIIMSIATTLLAPPVLNWLYRAWPECAERNRDVLRPELLHADRLTA